MSTTTVRRATWCAALAVLALTGCAPDADPVTSAPPAGSDEVATEVTAPQDAVTAEPEAATMTCAQIEPLAAPITGAFSLSVPDSSEDPSGTTCVWTNDAVASGSTDLADYATLGITVDGTSWSADEMSTLPGAFDDPRAQALGGRVFLASQADTLGEAGSVQLLLPDGTITVVATGFLLTASPDTAIPVDDVIGVAAEIAAHHG